MTWAVAVGSDALASSAVVAAAAAAVAGGRSCSRGRMVGTCRRPAADPKAGGTEPGVEESVAWVLTARSPTAAGGTAATAQHWAVVVVVVAAAVAAVVVVVS